MKKLLMAFCAAFLLPVTAFGLDPELARVVTYKENVAECLAPVSIKTIDGENRMLPNFGFDIEPGWHTMHGITKVNLKHCPVSEERIRKKVNVPPLEWLFEAGKIYYVGFDHSSPMRDNWRLVVWKVESMEDFSEEDEANGE